MSNSLLARVSPVTKSLMRKAVSIQMIRFNSGKQEDIIIHTGQVGVFWIIYSCLYTPNNHFKL